MDKINKINNLFSGFKDNSSNPPQQKDKNNQKNNQENDKILTFMELLKTLQKEDKKNKEEKNANTNTTDSTTNQWIQHKRFSENGGNDTRFERRTNIQDTREGLSREIDAEFKDIKQDEEGASGARIETGEISIQRGNAKTLRNDLRSSPQTAVKLHKVLMGNRNKAYEEIINQEKQRNHEKKNKSKDFSRNA